MEAPQREALRELRLGVVRHARAVDGKLAEIGEGHGVREQLLVVLIKEEERECLEISGSSLEDAQDGR